MRIFPDLAVIVLVLCLAGALEARAQTKVGTVDIERVLKEYGKTKEAEAKLKEMEAELKQLRGQ